MTVDVCKVTNRRVVQYSSLEDLVADAEQLAQGPVRTLGNKSFAQILTHLSIGMNGSIDGPTLLFPWYIRLAARWFFKQRAIKGPLTPGFMLSRDNEVKVWPTEVDANKSLEGLRRAVHRLKRETKRTAHPAFGPLSADEWNSFHIHHAELHMSFVMPA